MTSFCAVCHRRFVTFGHNPWPIATKGESCDPCNKFVVVPARIRQWKREGKVIDLEEMRAALRNV